MAEISVFSETDGSNWFVLKKTLRLYHKFILAHINVRPLLGTDVLKLPPLFLGLVPICFFFNAYGHTSGLMGCMGGSLQKAPLGLLESLLIVLCHSVFKNSLVQRLFTVSAICKWLFFGNFAGALKDKHSFQKKKQKTCVSTMAKGGCENKHLVMLEMWTNW